MFGSLARAGVVLTLLSNVAGADISLDAAIDAMVEPYAELNDFAGVILVGEGDEVVFRRGYGMADAELGVPNVPATRFMIGSISKQFTAAAILLLEEDGLLRVEDELARWIDDFPRADEITLHQLMTHTSGVPDVYALDAYPEWKHADPTIRDVVGRIAAAPLDFDPGTSYAYSNGGYLLLAHVVDLVTGTDHADFMRDRIFEPLAMRDTGVVTDRAIVPGLATGYDPLGQTGLRRAIQIAPALIAGAGAVYSNAPDLWLWHRALTTGTLLSAASAAKMTTDHGSAYGYGVSVYERFGGRVIEHDGRIAGYAADLARYVDRDAAVVILGNVQSSMRDRLRDDIASLLHGEEPPERSIRTGTSAAIDRREIMDAAGTYDFGPNFYVVVRSGNDRLHLRANAGEESEFFPAEGGEYFSRMLYAGARFVRDDEGRIEAMEYLSGGQAFRGELRR